MEFYRVSYEQYDGDECISSREQYYTTAEEAAKAEAYLKSLPHLPEDDFLVTRIRTSICRAQNTFVPWFTEEQMARWKKEAEEYQRYLDALCDYDDYSDDPAV